MIIKDLFGVLLTSQDVSLYNACGILECIINIIQEDRREDM